MIRAILILALLSLPVAAQEPTAQDYRTANRILAGKSKAEIDRLDYELTKVLDNRTKLAIDKMAQAMDAERTLKRTGTASAAELQAALNRTAAADAELQEAFQQCLTQFLAPKRLRVAAYLQWLRRQKAR